MSDDPVTSKLTSVFQDVFDDPALHIRRDMTAADVDGWDSLKHLRLILSIEREFKIRLPSTKVTGLKNVGDMIDLIRSYLPK
jgi:acyl carrier protein